MGLFEKAFASSAPGPDDDLWYNDVDGAYNSNKFLAGEDAAMSITTTFACVRVIAETIGSFPLSIFERFPDASRQPAFNHPLFHVLHDRPNDYQTKVEWVEMMQGHCTMRGNGYSKIELGPSGYARNLWPLDPTQVEVLRLKSGKPGYVYYGNGQREGILWEEMFHLRGLSSDGYVGLSPLTLMRKAYSMSARAEWYGEAFLRNAAKPSGILQADAEFEDAGMKDELEKDFEKKFSGGRIGSVAVIPPGLKWVQVGISNEDAQFLQLRRFQVEEICRIHRVQPHLVQHLERSTYNNIEHQGLDFINYTAMPWVTRWEMAIGRDLILDTSRYFAKFNMDALLRGTAKERYEAHALAIGVWKTKEEVRVKEDMNPEPTLGSLGEAPATAPSIPDARQGDNARSQAIFRATVGREVRREVAALRKIDEKASSPEEFVYAAADFYDKHSRQLAVNLAVTEDQARRWTGGSLMRLRSAADGNGKIGKTLDQWEQTRVQEVTESFALMEGVT